MSHRRAALLLILAAFPAACAQRAATGAGDAAHPALAGHAGSVPVAAQPGETRLRNLRQLTFGGQNAEAYFSADGERLIFQANWPGTRPCDQIYTMTVEGGDLRLVSTGQGATTCSYFFPAGDRILYSSTHAADSACPARPDFSRGYVWPLDDHDVYTARADGGDVRRLTDSPGYDAEATISPDGRTIVFTSVRDGDLDIYVMDADGSDVKRLTDTPGYDGGPFFSPDGRKIVYRAWHPTDPAELADYRALLADGLIRPGRLEVWVMNADGTGQRQVTNLGGANFAPYFHPDGERIIFSSNHADPKGREFDLYLIGSDGTGLERVTRSPEFDGFPMFDRDGKKLVFASNRHGGQPGETNVFIADWVDEPLRTAELCPAPGPEAATTLGTVRYLSDDRLGGRLAGSEEERCAGDFIAARLHELGLSPAGDNGTFFQSVELRSVVNPHAEAGTGRNVVAILEGSDPALRDEYVVVGAHYDHLGRGGFGSLAPGDSSVHNGADDNASGVAAMLEAARILAGRRPARSIVFLAFTGEEQGLLGSAAYARAPAVPLERTRAMLNMDMVGRLLTGKLLVSGTGTAAEWESILGEALAAESLTASFDPSGYGPSDHTSFYARDVPVLHFFTNVHTDYHKPSDDWDRIDVAGVEQIAAVVARVAREVAGRGAPLALRAGIGKPEPSASGSGSGYGAYLGTVPDFSPVDFGVRLSGVSKGSPAEAAGLRAGDVVIGVGETEIKDLYALTDALRAHEPGQTVRVVYLRGGEKRTVEVTLGRRSG